MKKLAFQTHELSKLQLIIFPDLPVKHRWVLSSQTHYYNQHQLNELDDFHSSILVALLCQRPVPVLGKAWGQLETGGWGGANWWWVQPVVCVPSQASHLTLSLQHHLGIPPAADFHAGVFPLPSSPVKEASTVSVFILCVIFCHFQGMLIYSATPFQVELLSKKCYSR